jgi:hypothetical protein
MSIYLSIREQALANGVSFISEFFVFSVAGVITVYEYKKSETKSAESKLKAQVI